MSRTTSNRQTMKNRVAIVTGASSGIGEATALALADQGARVVLAARRADRLESLQKRIEADGGSALPISTDLGKDRDLVNLHRQTLAHYGQIDILVNNAGYGRGGELVELTGKELRELVNVNILGTARLTQLVLPSMLDAGSGCLVFVTSITAEIPLPGMSMYCATKSGVNMLADCLRMELSDTDITVLSVLPGAVETEMLAPVLENMEQSTDTGSKSADVFDFLMRHVDSAEDFADLILRGIESGKSRVISGGVPAHSAIFLFKFLPRSWYRRLSRLVDKDVMLEVTRKLGA